MYIHAYIKTLLTPKGPGARHTLGFADKSNLFFCCKKMPFLRNEWKLYSGATSVHEDHSDHIFFFIILKPRVE